MEKLPETAAEWNQINDKVERITAGLLEIAQKGGYNLPQVVEIWSSIPTGDTSDTNYLEAAGRVILEASELVDQTYPDLQASQRVAYKCSLIGSLLTLKGIQLFENPAI